MIQYAPAIAALLFFVSGVQSAEHRRIDLAGDWDFTYTTSSTAQIPTPPPAIDYDTAIKVPGRWDDQLDRLRRAKWWSRASFTTALGPVQFLSGVGWHRTSIDAPANWSGRTVVLTIGNAVGTTHVWLNGKHVGSNDFGVYTPYTLDVTREIKPGTHNELVIAIDNAAPNIFGGWALLGNSGMASGLARSVTLDISAGPGRIADSYVRAGDDLNEVVWEAELTLPPKASQLGASRVEWLVREPKSGRVLKRGGWDVPTFSNVHRAVWKSHIDDIKPWSDREPNLYTTELRWLLHDGQLLDTKTERFGLRKWSYQGRRLFLNGEPLYLRLEFGAYYFPIDGAVSVSKNYWLQHMRRAKELGFNGINFAAQVCPIEMLEAADELGLILQCGDQVTTREEGTSRYQEVWNSIVRSTRAHPSMSIYGFGGELKYYEGVIEQNKAQMDLIKSLNPESLVMPQQAIHGIDYGFDDTRSVTQRPFPHHAERLSRYTQACDLFGHYSGGAFSHSYFGTPWRTMEDRFRIYEKPLVAHELFISASYLSPSNAEKYTGRIPPYLYTRLQNDLQEAGLLDKWPVYFDHTSRLQHICRKYCLEKARKCDELAGYELLGMMDMHFIPPEYAVGIVDEFLEMKPGDTLAGVRRYNDESVLLLDFDRGNDINRCYWEGDRFDADIMASLYGPSPLNGGVLTWRITADGKTLQADTKEIAHTSNGHVSTLEQLGIQWPHVEKTTRLNLSIELKGKGYALANDWDFWVFPKKPAPKAVAAVDNKLRDTLSQRFPDINHLTEKSTEKLRVVSKLRASDVTHLDQGGDVLLLGTSPFTAYTQWPYFYSAKGYRPFSNGGTIIAKHPIFAGHPNEGWNDWLFCPLMQGANSVLFDGAIDMTFDPLFEIISSAGHVRKQALAFEQRVGQGRLLVATFQFDMKNPSCITMLDSLFRYVQSDEFRPTHTVDAQELLRLMNPVAATGNRLVDPGFEKSGHWVTESGHYQLDDQSSHSGRKSLKLVITADDMRQRRDYASEVSSRQMRFDTSPRRLKLAAWFKTNVHAPDGVSTIRANIRYVDAHVRSDSFTITAPKSANEWTYAERTFDLDGKLSYADIYVGLAGAPGTVWIDDIYFGEATSDGAPSANAPGKLPAEVATEWHNNRVTRTFKLPVWYKVNDGQWAQGSTAVLDREGVQTLSLKNSSDDSQPRQETVRIDLSSPSVSLQIDPAPEQEAGIFTANSDARYTLSATDALSGVKSIEVSTDDGATYTKYKQPFTLSPGHHIIRCRVTDNAGNSTNAIKGNWITGSNENFLELSVQNSKK